MELNDKVKFSLDEARILILGSQVLAGFGYQAVVQPRFENLPAASQDLHVAALTLLLAGMALLMAPAARHQVVEGGEPTPAFHRFATGLLDVGLLPFALGLGVDLFLAGQLLGRERWLWPGVLGAAGSLCAAGFWYGPRLLYAPSPKAGEGKPMTDESTKPTEIKDKVNHALTETRMVLPGVQAMLGFQFIAMLTDAFADLPAGSKVVHVASLGFSAVTIILLITPAAFHRLVERGEATARQHRVTAGFLLAAMATLAPAMTGDLFVVVRKVSRSVPLAAGVAGTMLGLFYVLWFLVPVLLRLRKLERDNQRREADHPSGVPSLQ